MGNKYPPQIPQVGNKYPVHKSNQINQNTFTIGTQTTVNKLNDIYRRDAHTSSSSRVDSYNKRYITTKQQVINNQPSGVGKANIRAKWSDNHPGILSQVVKLGNKYPSTTSKKLST